MVTFTIDSNGPYFRLTIKVNGESHEYIEPYSIARYQFEPRILNALGKELRKAESEHIKDIQGV